MCVSLVLLVVVHYMNMHSYEVYTELNNSEQELIETMSLYSVLGLRIKDE